MARAWAHYRDLYALVRLQEIQGACIVALAQEYRGACTAHERARATCLDSGGAVVWDQAGYDMAMARLAQARATLFGALEELKMREGKR